MFGQPENMLWQSDIGRTELSLAARHASINAAKVSCLTTALPFAISKEVGAGDCYVGQIGCMEHCSAAPPSGIRLVRVSGGGLICVKRGSRARTDYCPKSGADEAGLATKM